MDRKPRLAIRRAGGPRETCRRRAGTVAVLGLICAVTAGCTSTVLAGRPASMLDDPDRVGGLPANDGPNGVRSKAPAPTGAARGSDGGAEDHLAVTAINDIQDFWSTAYPDFFAGPFTPVSALIFYDSTDPSSPGICGSRTTYRVVNASYCLLDDSVSWDRGSLIPKARTFFGDVAVAGLLAHELGHAVQNRAHLVRRLLTRTIVKEQQADCFAGVYLRWVADGHSPRFTMNTTDGLDHVLAGGITLRDPVDEPEFARDAHGSALDRVGAFQEGFDGDPSTCAAIDMKEVDRRRTGLPKALLFYPVGDSEAGETPIDGDSLTALMQTLGQIFQPGSAPTLTVGGDGTCADARPSPPASYCPTRSRWICPPCSASAPTPIGTAVTCCRVTTRRSQR